ncbi:MAG: RNA methyltransferase substrate-binding domain-containing protein, partial [Actinomycetota bacterium]|nr:RNA methyltransferase substrate-binding domain-containing protein [Actinomycetota bacterium]MEC8970355.1 RNA methyltransferase substrate-binding domain-containing protein [Actinomycetota bacterium]
MGNRSDGPPKGLGGDQVEGRQAVRELLLAGTRRTREVLMAGDLDPAPILDDIIDLADEARVTIREVSRSKFESVARTDAPQGVLALAQPIREHELEDLLGSDASGRDPFLLLL